MGHDRHNDPSRHGDYRDILMWWTRWCQRHYDAHVHGGAGDSMTLPSSLALSAKAVIVSDSEPQEGQMAPMGRQLGITVPGAIVT